MDKLLEMEARVEKALQAGEKQTAVSELYELIVAWAKQKNFTKAETLRDRLFEVDPMALNEIVKSAEIIEQEKSEALDAEHLKNFSMLYSTLTPEETLAFYYALKSFSLEEDQPVFKEGEKNPRLYLLDKGEIKLTHGRPEAETLLKNLSPGDIFGAETFFSRKLFCTFSAHTRTQARVSILENTVLEGWRDSFPGIEGKLVEICFRAGAIQETLDQKAVSRRNQNRLTLSGTVGLQLIGKDGKPSGTPFKGGAVDISRGGAAFNVSISKSETARLLLGRRLVMTCRLPLKGGVKGIRKSGRILGVEPHLFNDYTIRVLFDKELPQNLLDNLDLSSSARSPDLDLKIEQQ